MRGIIILIAVSTLLLSNSDCKKKKTAGAYKGRLEIAALCMNYTISVIEGNIDTSLVVGSWTDENTGIKYKNVFRLDNPCDFPKSLKQGDEFYFDIDSSAGKQCAVCMAYYPTPPKALAIRTEGK